MADEIISSRQRLLDRARERFPERTFSDIGAEPQEGVADLDDSVNEMLEDYANRQAEYDANNDKLKKLLVSDPASAEFIQKWVETGDPRTALVEIFGEELGIAEEAAANFKNELEGWRERRAANEALEAEAEANWQKSLADLLAWGTERQLSEDQMRDIMLRLLAVTFNGMANKYGPDDFEMALHSMNYDTDVAAARAAGEVAGRNERIVAERRDRMVANAMPPAGGAAQGGRAVERQPKPVNTSPFAGIK